MYEQLAQLGLVHSHIAHIRSSQAFALNLLAPLTLDKWSQLARYHLADPGAEVRRPPQFEYVDPVDGLHEGTKASPHTTQVDCLVEVYLTGERKHLMLIEVKLSEDNFSTCSAFTSPGNPRREICRQPLPFGGNRAGCFQLCNHDREHRRTYDIALGAMPTEPRRMGCWFRDGANQVMRNAALARARVQRDDAQSASVFLLAPDDHHAIWHQWQQHVELLDWVTGITFGSIPASQVVALHEPDQARALFTRYLLPQVLLETRIAQQLLDQHFPHGVNVTRLDDDGTLNYTDHVPRLPVVAVSDTEIDFETPYPAGPFRHRAPRSIFDGALSEIRLAEDFGSRILTPNRAGSADASCQELEKWAHELQVRAPWWTAPVNHG